MTDQNPIDALTQKRSANVAKVNKLSEQLAALQRENDEILVAIRALERLGFKAAHGGMGRLEDQPIFSGTQAKLIDITVPDMIFAIINDDIIGDGVDATTIIAEIKRRYMPDPDPNVIRPTLWRLTKAKRLIKMGGKYFLPSQSHISDGEEEEEEQDEVVDQRPSKNDPSSAPPPDGSDAEVYEEYDDSIEFPTSPSHPASR